VDLAALLGAVPFVVLLFPFLPAGFMSDGFKSIAIRAGAWTMILLAPPPAIEGAIAPLRGLATAASTNRPRLVDDGMCA